MTTQFQPPDFPVEGAGNQEAERPFRRGRDLRVFLLEYYALFVGSVLIAALFIAWLGNTRLERERTTEDRQLVEAIIALVDRPDQSVESVFQELNAWLPLLVGDQAASITVLDADGDIALHLAGNAGSKSGADWNAWLERISRIARRSNAGSFETEDPDGQSWSHSYGRAQNSGWHVIVQRPTEATFSLGQRFGQGLLTAVAIYLIAGVFFWLALSRLVITPLERLELFSGLVRWRGQATKEELTRLGELSSRQDQVGSLARSLIAMAQHIEARFLELASLLSTTRTVAASLEESRVIDNILDEAQNLLAVDFSAVVALDQRAGVFRIRSSRGLPEDYANQLRIAPSEPNSPAMRALRRQGPVQVSDTDSDLSFVAFRDRADAVGYRSLLATPLLAKHAPPAVLLLYKLQPYRYSFSELELISSFANHAAIAMENAALYLLTDAKLQEQTRRLEAIVESLTDGLFLESLAGEVLYCNQQTANLLEIPRESALQKGSMELAQLLLSTALDRPGAATKYQEAIWGHKDRSFDIARNRSDGKRQDLRITLFEVTDHTGDLIGRGQLWQDITRDKELDRMKSTLLTTVSHELRTPLAAIKGYATTLLADDVSWDETSQREFVQTISEETDRLNELVESLLEMSRIEAGMIEVRQELHTVDDLISSALQHLTPAISQRVSVEVPEDLPPVWMDVSLLQTVVRNLVENALKYSPTDAPIQIKAHRENGRVSIAVQDFGPGIPEEIQEKIFTPFFRADNRLTRRAGGVGLGLAICKGFVEANHGEVWVRDGQPGTIFGFTLPL